MAPEAIRGAVIAFTLAISGLAAIAFTAGNSPAGVAASEPGQSATPNTSFLVELGEPAGRSAEQLAPDAVLRQVDVVQPGGEFVFHFVSPGDEKEFEVRVPPQKSSSSVLQARETPPSPLSFGGFSRPALDLGALRVSPGEALLKATSHWQGCTPRSLTLFGEGEAISWYVSCALPEGRVTAGTVDGRTGHFQPSSAPPIWPAPTALPTG